MSMGFNPNGIVLPIASILPLKQVRASLKGTKKYQQVLASVREVGVIEPLVVFPQGDAGAYVLLDGHVRLEVLKQLGRAEARCLISTDDESYTYNKRVNQLPPIQEHVMILKAIKGGVPEERIAKALNVDVASIRQKRDLLMGICKEVAEILKNKHVSPGAFYLLRKMNPVRQIEVAELLAAANNFSVPYVKALLAATPSEMLIDSEKSQSVEGLSPDQVARMEKEMEALQRDLKQVEESHGNEVFNLVLARGYLAKLFGNARIVRYLTQHCPDILRELQSICEATMPDVAPAPKPSS